MLLQGRGVSVANDRPLFGCSKLAHSRKIGDDAMPFVPAANTIRVATRFLSVTGEQAVNVQHFQADPGPVTPASITAFLTAYKAWYSASWVNVASSSWQTDLFEVRDMTSAEGIVVSDVETITGVLAGASLPAQNTIAISTRTGLAGRSRRGRVFHVGLDEASVVGSRVVLAAATNLVDVYNGLIDALDGSGWVWVVASFVSNGAPRATALLTPITSVILTDTVVDSMDTRKPVSV